MIPRRDDRPADELGASCHERFRVRGRIVDLERQPNPTADRLTRLDAVDHGRVLDREHLERGAACVEERAACALLFPGLLERKS